MKPTEYTPAAKDALSDAEQTAGRLGRTLAGSEHLLLGFFVSKDSIAAKILSARGISRDSVMKLMYPDGEEDRQESRKAEGFTPRLLRILERSAAEASRASSFLTGTGHMLLSVAS